MSVEYTAGDLIVYFDAETGFACEGAVIGFYPSVNTLSFSIDLGEPSPGRCSVTLDKVVHYRDAPPWLIDLVKRGGWTADAKERAAYRQEGWRQRRDDNLRELFAKKERPNLRAVT